MTKIIVIKEADKREAVIIMDSVRYEQMIYKQRGDKNTYKKVDPPCHNKTMRANNALIKKYEIFFRKAFFLASLAKWLSVRL